VTSGKGRGRYYMPTAIKCAVYYVLEYRRVKGVMCFDLKFVTDSNEGDY
jgi:hypothetical protein